jgi:MFS transporter, MHS family, proline/betaine transporter
LDLSYFSLLQTSGSFLGAISSFVLRASLTHNQLVQWGWRIPFLLGILVSYFGFYLRSHGGDHDGAHVPQQSEHSEEHLTEPGPPASTENDNVVYSMDTTNSNNPFVEAFSPHNRRSLLAASLVPMLWSSGFYLFFVWMAVFMNELIANPVPGAFLISSIALLLSVCLLFPVAGWMSDRYGRIRIMTIGGLLMAVLSPLLVMAIGRGNPALALISQCTIGISLSLFSAPMCAWLVEAFDPRARLTSVAIGYNIAQAIAGGGTPALATLITEQLGPRWPGWIATVMAIASLSGLLCVSPKPSHYQHPTTTLHRKTSDGLSRIEASSDRENGTLCTT